VRGELHSAPAPNWAYPHRTAPRQRAPRSARRSQRRFGYVAVVVLVECECPKFELHGVVGRRPEMDAADVLRRTWEGRALEREGRARREHSVRDDGDTECRVQ
jgi:hypothetical protein